MRALYAETLAALLAPRRLLPITLVTAPLLWAQYWFSNRSLVAVGVAVVVVVVFLATGPFACRALFLRGPLSVPRRLLHGALYTALGVGTGLLMAGGLDMVWFGASFLTGSVNLAVICGLFWVGGWGLGRDIELEHSLDAARVHGEALEREAERAQLLAVRAHLNPHFLFNTLNAIAEWCREDGEVAERAILQLSGILREVLGGIEIAAWPLERELRLARDVWALHTLRDPSWFDVAWDVPSPTPDVAVPPMILLPLVENAVKHGPAQGHRGTLGLAVSVGDDGVTIHIDNPGSYAGPREGGQGVGLVQRRLVLAYAHGTSLTLQTRDDGTRATLIVPTEGPT